MTMASTADLRIQHYKQLRVDTEINAELDVEEDLHHQKTGDTVT